MAGLDHFIHLCARAVPDVRVRAPILYLSKEGAHSDAVFEPRSAVAAIRTFWSPQSASARGLDLGAHERPSGPSTHAGVSCQKRSVN